MDSKTVSSSVHGKKGPMSKITNLIAVLCPGTLAKPIFYR